MSILNRNDNGMGLRQVTRISTCLIYTNNFLPHPNKTIKWGRASMRIFFFLSNFNYFNILKINIFYN